ncbi:MAG: diacylglycerol kinase family lipid kinase [Actinobacteria bacterium]|nr:diacylglycerol kinase family lipid kinase [Actinomycetota bacterium]
MRWTAVVNPTAGRGRTRRMLPSLSTALTGTDLEVDIRVARDVDETRDAACDAFAAGRGVIACGGDGTVSMLAGIAAETGGLLAIMPTGAGNDFARALAIRRRTPEAAVEVLRTGREVRLDLAKANGRWFTTVANTGFDAEVNRWANGVRHLSGTALYLAGAARTLAVYRPRSFQVQLDDGPPRAVDAWLLAAGNTPLYGGGLRIAPHARADDGMLDLCIVGATSRRAFLANFPRVFNGTHTRHPAVEILRARTITIESRDPCPMNAYASGELIGPLPARLEAVPAAVRVMVPADWDGTGR